MIQPLDGLTIVLDNHTETNLPTLRWGCGCMVACDWVLLLLELMVSFLPVRCPHFWHQGNGCKAKDLQGPYHRPPKPLMDLPSPAPWSKHPWRCPLRAVTALPLVQIRPSHSPETHRASYDHRLHRRNFLRVPQCYKLCFRKNGASERLLRCPKGSHVGHLPHRIQWEVCHCPIAMLSNLVVDVLMLR